MASFVDENVYLLHQTFPSREHLQEQFCSKAHPEPYNCLFKNASVINVIPDPDVPPQCDTSSEEYSFLLYLVLLTF